VSTAAMAAHFGKRLIIISYRRSRAKNLIKTWIGKWVLEISRRIHHSSAN
jgi:hypothetical protein